MQDDRHEGEERVASFKDIRIKYLEDKVRVVMLTLREVEKDISTATLVAGPVKSILNNAANRLQEALDGKGG